MSTSDSIKAAASGETALGTFSEAATTDAMIHEALRRLDPANDDHWIADGKPAMDALNALLPAAITRKRLEEVAPDFVRPTQQPADVGQQQQDADASASAPGEMFGGKGDHDANGEAGGAHAPVGVDSEAQVSVEGRLSGVEADLAYLRGVFGWPTKDA